MSLTYRELTEAQLDALIVRVKTALEHGLSLSNEDLQVVLDILLSFAQLQERLADNEITLHKLRKLAGIVSASEKFKDVVAKPRGEGAKPKAKKRSPSPEPVIHERCTHRIEGLAKGQRCPECLRGTLYKYTPASVVRISGQTPLKSTQHLLERLRCNTCGAV